MKCPKCGGKFSPVKNTTVTEDNEVYRRRRCKSCGHTFYTIEFQVEENELFMNDWYKALANERKEKGEGRMIQFENLEVMGWEYAIRGMRNPMNSWEKSDSFMCREVEDASCFDDCYFRDNCPVYGDEEFFVIGSNDRDLMMKLRNAGADHRKFMRMITVYVDITAPLYWWKEFDTYKVGTVANSCSTMHKIHAKEFTLDDFSREHLEGRALNTLEDIVDDLNYYREYYLSMEEQKVPGANERAKELWWQMIQLLPSSYNQRRTIMMNYEVLANIYKSRKNHKLDEWRELCKWIETLPYSELITGEKE